MSNDFNAGNKSSFCRVVYSKHLNTIGYKITNIHHECRYGSTCRGCHNPSEFKQLSHITKWEKKNKASINLLEISDSIKNSFMEEAEKIKNPKYKSSIIHASTLSFDKLLHYWFDITCYHRKIAKTLKYQSSCDGYTNIKDIPRFYLENEDDVWALERVIHYCNDYKTMIDNRGKPFIVKQVCVGHKNCKNGVHDYKDLVCIDDLIHGKCSCEQYNYDERRESILKDIEEQKKKLVGGVDEDGFVTTITKPMRAQINEEIVKLQSHLSSLRPIMIHYTEQGIIPLAQRIKEREESKPKDIDVVEIKTKTVRRVKKKGK